MVMDPSCGASSPLLVKERFDANCGRTGRVKLFELLRISIPVPLLTLNVVYEVHADA